MQEPDRLGLAKSRIRPLPQRPASVVADQPGRGTRAGGGGDQQWWARSAAGSGEGLSGTRVLRMGANFLGVIGLGSSGRSIPTDNSIELRFAMWRLLKFTVNLGI